jgi:hypothetical protein
MLRYWIVAAALCAVSTASSAGVTIHFDGTASSDDVVGRILKTACDRAAALKWDCRPASPESLRDDPVTLSMLRELGSGDDLASVRGVVINPHPMSEPLTLAFTKSLQTKNFIKTQFAGPDVHIQVVELLAELRPLFTALNVRDESGYWDKRDRAALERAMEAVDVFVAEAKKTKGAQGPQKIAGGRIVDLIGPKLIAVGSFAIPWPDGFSRQPEQRSIRLKGLEGETVLISPAFSPDPSEARKLQETLRSFAETKLQNLAASKGDVVQPLKKTEVSGPIHYYSTATHSLKLLRDYFYLQYVLIGKWGGALFTIEGPGKAVDKALVFDKTFQGTQEKDPTAEGKDASSGTGPK